MTVTRVVPGISNERVVFIYDDQAGPIADDGTWTITLPADFQDLPILPMIMQVGTYGAGDAGARTFTGRTFGSVGSVASDLRDLGIARHKKRTSLITTAAATDTATGVALANAMKAAWNTHAADVVAHIAADATNVVAAADATDDATGITLANELKGDFNTHQDSATYHKNAGGEGGATFADTSAANATDAATLYVLLNAEKAAINHHFASAAGGGSITLESYVEGTGVLTLRNQTGESLSAIRTVLALVPVA